MSRTRSRRSGFTLLEAMIALGIFVVVGYAVGVAVGAGNHSQRVVTRLAAEDRAVREASNSLIDELRETSDAQINIATLADGNHQVRFMLPIDLGGTAAWGVDDPVVGGDPVAQNKENWSVRYTVRDVSIDGKTVKRLLRQVLDAALNVQYEKVIVDGLRRGNVDPPGFKVVKTGDVWEITLSTEGREEGKSGIRAVFHVQTRNQ